MAMSEASVLLVDDDPRILRMLERTLGAEGYDVAAVPDGGAALASVERSVPDLIVLDVAMPGLDGLAVTRRVRGKRLAVPILLLTARDALEDRVAGLDAGADDYIVKPFALAELEARLRAVLRRPGGRDGPVRACGRLVLDVASRAVSVEGVPLDLSRREAALLDELLRAVGRVVVKDTLEERLYGFDEPVTPNALEAAVSRLRRRLGEAGAGVRIETKRGIGYRLVAGEET